MNSRSNKAETQPKKSAKQKAGTNSTQKTNVADKPTPSQSSIMVVLVRELGARLFRTDAREGYVVIPVNGHHEVLRISSITFRNYISGLLYSSTGRVPQAAALSEAVQQLQAMALFDQTSAVCEVHLRVARHGNKVYVDLGNNDWEVVEIDAQGWRVVKQSPVMFVRSNSMRPIPCPERGGSMEEIRKLVNCGDDDNFALMCGWIVGAFNPGGPFPVLCLHGEMGSGKSSTCELLRHLVDPSQTPHRALPREDRDLWIAAKWSHLLSFDNVSTIPDWLSDALCRISTGGSYGVRTHYSDDEEQLFQATRPILLNGIPDAAVKPDLVDRCIVFNLPAIAADRRITKNEWSERCERSIPRIMGAIFDAVSSSLRNWDNVQLSSLARMADFEKWVTAAAMSCNGFARDFSTAYRRNRDDINSTILEANALGSSLMRLVNQGNSFHGRASDLLELLRSGQSAEWRYSPGWLKNPQTLAGELRRIAPNLARAGIRVQLDSARDHGNCKLIEIRKEVV